MTHHRRPTLIRRAVSLLFLLLLFFGINIQLSLAQSGSIVTGPVVGSDTSTLGSLGKPNQSRIWYNSKAQRWDALIPKIDVPGTSSASDHYIMTDINGAQTFTTIELEDRNTGRADVYWDDATSTLYALGSHGSDTQFWRVRYDAGSDSYVIEVGVSGNGVSVPGIANQDRNQPASIYVTPNGAIWVGVMRDGALVIQHSSDGGATWLAAAVTLDTAVIVGVTTWSHFEFGGTTYAALFAGENDGAAPASQNYYWIIDQTADPSNLSNWDNQSSSIPAPVGTEESDDHVSSARDQDGNQYFVTKTSSGSPTDPLIKLFRRTPEGVWTQYKVTETQDRPEESRPSIVIDDTNSDIYLYTSLTSSAINAGFEKIAGRRMASLDALNELATAPYVTLFGVPGDVFGNVITPEHSVNAETDIVVLAQNQTEETIWYSFEDIGANSPPTVNAGPDQIVFENAVVNLAPAFFSDLNAQDTHTATINWGDNTAIDVGAVDQLANIVQGQHTYQTPGTYTVTVTVIDNEQQSGSDALTVTVVHGFLEFCAYAGEDELKVEDEGTTDCDLAAEDKLELKNDSVVLGNVTSRQDEVKLEDRSQLTGSIIAADKIDLEKEVFVGQDITSGYKVEVGEYSVVNGNVTASESVSLKSNSDINGTISQGAPAPLFTPITPVNVSVNANGPDVKVKKGSSRLLTPGEYGKLDVEEDATLLLTSGTYTFEEFFVDEDAFVNFDLSLGSVIIKVEKDVEMKDRVVMSVNGGSAKNILFLVEGDDIKLGKEGIYLGTFLAPDAHVDLMDDANLTGALYGKKVHIKQRAALIGEPALALFAELYVP